MIDFIIYLIAFFITIPILFTIGIYIITLKSTRKNKRTPKRALHIAVNWSAVLYIISVSILVQDLFGMKITGIILILFLALLAIIIFKQWKNNSDIRFIKAIKLLWKICFLLFLFLYVTLIIIGIIMQIIN